MWNSIKKTPPPKGILINTKISDAAGDRNEQPLKWDGELWWSDSMYIYYTPTHWKFIS